MAYVVKLQGHVAYFDSDCIILRRDRHPQRVERPAISTVVSGKARRGSKIMAKLETALGVDL
jgi:sRNA-binding regulator protein Hfq